MFHYVECSAISQLIKDLFQALFSSSTFSHCLIVNTQDVEQIHMCETDSLRSDVFLVALRSYSCRVKSMYVFQICIIFLTELLSRDAVHNIAGMLLGILKRLRTSCWRIMWREKIQYELSICPFLPFRFFDFLLGNILGEMWTAFTCH